MSAGSSTENAIVSPFPEVSSSRQSADRFLIVTVGWGQLLIENLCDRIQARSDISFAHIITSTRDLLEFDHVSGRNDLYNLRNHPAFAEPVADRELLASLEGPDMLTIHNMIESDRVVRHLHHADALAYATSLARSLQDAYAELRPSVVLGSFDNLHTGISLAVARKMGIPWIALSFAALPVGVTGICSGLTPNSVFIVDEQEEADLRRLAEKTLRDHVSKTSIVPAYVSANTLAMVVRRVPAHVKAFADRVKRSIAGTLDPYTDYPLAWLVRAYVRKRFNVITRPNSWFCDTPPSTPYVFFGFHMQPESSIDVWAPFHANQVGVVEAISRAIPPTHELMVKIHVSDADSYSRADLRRIARLPGVRIVSPFASSRQFQEKASLIITIMGTMTMEAALLGKPVLTFGESKFSLMPSVTRIRGGYTELPNQIREKLTEAPPSRDDILRGLMEFLAFYPPGCYNDWEKRPTDLEIDNFVKQFSALRVYLESSHGELESVSA